MKTALVNAGKAQLAAQLDGLVGDKIPGGVPDASKVLDQPGEAAKNAFGGLLGGKDGDKKNKDK
ncbi:MAG: hypothetical protein IPK83_10395 [Planctomycetes bacterium]|nr:hypothetical protein [Planctomycetota bacterium]